MAKSHTNEIADNPELVRETPGGTTPLSHDQLEYMADLVGELQEMADRSGMQTLAAILGLALTEANEQVARRRVR